MNHVELSIGDDAIFSKPTAFVDCTQNRSFKLKESPTLTKKPSFTERLGRFDMDVLNGFTDYIPDEYLSQSQNQMQSQESIELSDDEINYSMQRDTTKTAYGKTDFDAKDKSDDLSDDEINYSMQHHVPDAMLDKQDELSPNNNFDYCFWENDINMENDYYNPPGLMDFTCPDSNSKNLETEANLVNQSVCNILEKTFEHGSPVAEIVKRKSFKKVNSESVLRSRYENAMPSTSKRTPDKSLRPIIDFESPKELYSSTPPPSPPPSSQPTAETRTDLSNDEYEIHIGSLTPKPDYEQMDTTAIEMELRKYGLKPSLRRRQAIICLEYIYNRTHPFMEMTNDLDHSPQQKQVKESDKIPDVADQANEPQINFNVGFTACNLVDDKFKNRSEEKIFLPSQLRAKVHWF